MKVIEQMDIVREYVSLFSSLRRELGIPEKQPLIDYGFGGRPAYKLDKDFQRVLVEAINIYNQGYDLLDRRFYYGLETVKPDEECFSIKEKGDGDNKMWVALNIKIPGWLKEIGDQRKKERKEIIKKKLKEQNI